MTADLDLLEVAVRLGIAAGLGSLLGLEREFDGQDAGFRTHLLVAIGSALFAVASVGAFDAFIGLRSSTNVTVDVTRIAAYVAPGVGFIGGGAILKYGGKVTGITTAASLWTAAAIGVASGLGFWTGGVVATVIAVIALQALKPVGNAAARLGRRRHSALGIRVDDDAGPELLASVLGEFEGIDIQVVRFGVGPGEDGVISVEVWDQPERLHDPDLLARIAALPGVRSVATAANA